MILGIRDAEKIMAIMGIPDDEVVTSVIDRARLHKAKGNAAAVDVAVRLLNGRKDLTDEQREEVKAMNW